MTECARHNHGTTCEGAGHVPECPACGAHLYAWNRSTADARYCADCGDRFPSFHPRSVDPPQKLPERAEWEDGLEVGGDQCDSCGADEYRLRQPVPVSGAWFVRCVGCGAVYPIADRPGRELVW